MTPFGKVSRAAVVSLSPAELRVYALLCCYRNRDGEAWPRVSTMAKDLALSPRRVREVMRALADGGWIEKRKIYDDQTRWYVRLAPEPADDHQGAEGDPQESGGPPAAVAEGDPPKATQTPLLGTDQGTDQEQELDGAGEREKVLAGETIPSVLFLQLVVESWARATGRRPGRVKVTRPRASLIESSAKLYGQATVLKAAEGVALSDFHMGRERNSDKKYDDLEVALRQKPRNNLERFSSLWDENGGPPGAPAVETAGHDGAPLITTDVHGWENRAAVAIQNGWSFGECLRREPTDAERLALLWWRVMACFLEAELVPEAESVLNGAGWWPHRPDGSGVLLTSEAQA